MATTIGATDYRTGRRIGISIVGPGRTRTLSLPPLVAYGLMSLGVILGLWTAAATFYVVCYDDLFAAVLTREAATQNAYESNLASIQTNLDREASRALVLENDVAAQLSAITERQAAIERRAAVLNAMSARANGKSDAAAGGDRLDGLSLRGGEDALSGRRSDLSPGALQGDVARLLGRLDHVETAQVAAAAGMAHPAAAAAARLRAALALVGVSPKQMAGLAPASYGNERAQGGPFVPLGDRDRGSPFWTAAARADAEVMELAHLQEIARVVPLRQPLTGPLDVTSDFGPRLDPFLGRAALHTGVDLHAEQGAPVHATAAGTVTIAEREGGYGNLVEIDHGNGYATRYAHLATINVTLHQHVDVGQIVGAVGATGRATGPHLHYETRIAGEPVDPSRFLHAGATIDKADGTDTYAALQR